MPINLIADKWPATELFGWRSQGNQSRIEDIEIKVRTDDPSIGDGLSYPFESRNRADRIQFLHTFRVTLRIRYGERIADKWDAQGRREFLNVGRAKSSGLQRVFECVLHT